MSFVYAKKIGKSIAIFADTKITFDQPDSITLFSRESQKKIIQFGMIKNIIISKNFCVSYAGNNIVYANELLQKINHVTLQEMLQLALDINLKGKSNGAEFIICYANLDEQYIFQIKEGKCTDVSVAWIGSYDAFAYFQGVRNHAFTSNVKSNIPHGVEITFGTSTQTDEESEYQQLFDAFHKTVWDSGDGSVGGFVVPVLFDKKTNQFWYKGYIKSYAKMEQTTKGLSLPMYQGAESGTYSVLFYESPRFIGIYIPQNFMGIIYNNYRAVPEDYEITQTASFWIPSITRIGQLDFYVQTSAQGMKPPGFLGFNPDVIDDYLKRVWFYEDNPRLAVLYIDKAIEIVTTQHRDEWRLDELQSIKQNIQSGLTR